METQIDLILYGTSILALVLFSGACTALEIISLSRLDHGEEEDEGTTAANWLGADPVNNGLALGVARAVAMAYVIVASFRLGLRGIFGGVENPILPTSIFVAISLLLPVFVSKILALQGAERFLSVTRYATYPAAYLLKPVAMAVGRIVRATSPTLLRLLAFQFIPLREKIEAFGAQDGQKPDEEQMLMSSILEFGETRVREVMVPRIDIVAVDMSMDTGDALEVIMKAGHSRVPVYEDKVDKIIGTVYTKDLLRKIVEGEDFSLADIAREAFFVPESKMIDELLTEFKARKQHLAIVVDEYGGTAGIVTLEDVLEELVGDIQDEFDTEEELITRVDEDTAVCNAKVHLDELSDEFGIEFPEESPDSLGGLLYQMIGHVPREGDKVSLGPIEFEIQSVERQRIDKVEIRGLGSVGSARRDAEDSAV